MFRDRTEPTLFRAGTVPETVPVRSLIVTHPLAAITLQVATIKVATCLVLAKVAKRYVTFLPRQE